MRRAAVVHLDLLRCAPSPRHHTTATQTTTDSGAAGLLAAVVDLVRRCAIEYETVTQQQRCQLAGMQTVLGRMRQDDVADCPARLATCALEDATVEMVLRAADRDWSARDKIFRDHIHWMENACTVVPDLHTNALPTVPTQVDTCARSCQQCSLNCSSFRLELQRGYFSRQLQRAHTECERQCSEVREQLSRALSDAALASVREEEARRRCDQIAAHMKERMEQLEVANEKSKRELQRTQLKLHAARRKLLEQKWALSSAEPLARELEAAAAAAEAAGLLPSQIRAEQTDRLQLSRRTPLLDDNRADANPCSPIPLHRPDLHSNNRRYNDIPVVGTRQRRFSAPNVLCNEVQSPGQLGSKGVGPEISQSIVKDTRAARSNEAPRIPPAHLQPVTLEARSWAPVNGPRSASVIAVVHALSSVQVRV